MTDLSDRAERDEMRARVHETPHVPVTYDGDDGYAPPESCRECGEEWPCAWFALRLALDLLDSQGEELERLRGALRLAREHAVNDDGDAVLDVIDSALASRSSTERDGNTCPTCGDPITDENRALHLGIENAEVEDG